MLSANNILSPAHGAPLATPTQDMVLGSYYLTYGPDEQKLEELREVLGAGKWDEKKHGKRPHVFRSAQEAELSYDSGAVSLHDLSEHRLRHTTEHRLTTVGRIIFNERIERALEEALGEEFDPSTYEFVNMPLRKRDMNAVIERLVEVHGPYATALVLDAFKDLGFHFASQAGITISKNDVVIPPEKDEILQNYEGQVSEIHDQYDMGLITQEERKEAVVEKWTAATDEVGEAMQRNLDHLNPVFMMANSGARGSFKQIRQLA
jgi:DNA-directed RNA polymerase subunit beta'